LEPATHGSVVDTGIEDLVYDYARKHDGEMSIQSCANELGRTPEEIKNALGRLRDTGKIVIE
jgi:predicted transcriptional regulator